MVAFVRFRLWRIVTRVVAFAVSVADEVGFR